MVGPLPIDAGWTLRFGHHCLPSDVITKSGDACSCSSCCGLSSQPFRLLWLSALECSRQGTPHVWDSADEGTGLAVSISVSSWLSVWATCSSRVRFEF